MNISSVHRPECDFFFVEDSDKMCQQHILLGITPCSKGGHTQGPEQQSALRHKSSKKHEILRPGNTKSNINYSVYTIAVFLNWIPASAISLGMMVPTVFMLLSAHRYCCCTYR